MRSALLLCSAALWLAPAPPARAGQLEDDEAALKEAKIGTDGPALLQFFRQRVLPEADKQRVRALIKQLGDDSFRVREKASAALVALGPGIAPMLRQPGATTDPEVLSRAEECLIAVEKTSTVPLLSAAVRLLGQRKPDGAAKALLDFAPFSEHEEVSEVLRATLLPLALKDGKPDPALLAALRDKQAACRALAAETLIRVKALEGAAARKLLADDAVFVRFRTALALLDRNDRSAVVPLIDALPKLPLQHAWVAEDVLFRLAGDKAPRVAVREDAGSRNAAHDAWRAWWKTHGAKVDLARLKDRAPYLGLTLIAFQDFQGQGKLMEQGRDGKTRWQFGGLSYPVDVQALPGQRILIAESNAGRVTERNTRGEIVWEKQANCPVSCQRLANGNTFIATPSVICEYNAEGEQVFRHNRGRWDIVAARKHRNGEYILVTRTHLVRLDAKGKEVGSFAIGRTFNYCSFDILPNGNLLLPLHRLNKVAEYTLTGKEVWSARVPFATSARRLPNGNVLAVSMNDQRVVELGKDGKTVSQQLLRGTLFCVLRR